MLIVETRFFLQYHDCRIKIWRHHVESLPNYCVIHHYTGPVLRIMAWGGIGFLCHIRLVRNAGTLNSQYYIFEVLESVTLPYIQCLPSAIFQQYDARQNLSRNVLELSLSI
ncbi:transposable element Tcb1 transposase [Trichonephila clavipes]|nr:transposable element Tcb1 transposase [Trichonephila clavipes]